MGKAEYLDQLRAQLSGRLSAQELERIMEYYRSYFDEVGQAREQEIIAELGSPEALAGQLTQTQATQDASAPGEGCGRRRHTGWRVVLALCAAPIVLPLALALVVLVIALAVAVLAVLLAVGLAGIACVGAGIFAAGAGVSVIFSSGITTMMYFVGLGLLASGLGVLLLAGALALTRVCLSGTGRLLGRAIHRNRGGAEA